MNRLPLLKVKILPLWVTLGDLRCNNSNEDVKKAIGFISKTTTLHAHHTFFSSSAVIWIWSENALFHVLRTSEEVKLVFSFLFLNLDVVFKNSTSGEFAYVWQSHWVSCDGEWKNALILFLSDIKLPSLSLDRNYNKVLISWPTAGCQECLNKLSLNTRFTIY